MLELMMISLHMMKNPSILFQPPDNISAVHVVYNTHGKGVGQGVTINCFLSLRTTVISVMEHDNPSKIFLGYQ
jgi:hypothetical protein